MTDCPVCIWHATNVDPQTLSHLQCLDCGKPWSEHTSEEKPIAPPGMAYAVNPAHMSFELLTR